MYLVRVVLVMVGFPTVSALASLIAWIGRYLASDASRAFDCRCLFGEPCWPSLEEFAGLASYLSKPLIYPLPTAHPCYVAPDSADCLAVHENWDSGNWRSNRSGAAQHPNFETFISTVTGTVHGCPLNASLHIPCKQGNVPVVGVDARTVEDVQRAVTFAAAHNLRLVIKNTGYVFHVDRSRGILNTSGYARHDFLGRSSGRGSFLLWVHHLKEIVMHDTFRPQGAPSGDVYEKGMPPQEVPYNS